MMLFRACYKIVPVAQVEYSGRQHMVTVGDMYETYFIRAVPGSKAAADAVVCVH